MKRNKVSTIIVLVALLAIVAVASIRFMAGRAAAGGRRRNAPIVKAEKPVRETVAYSLQSTGDVLAIQQAAIVARISGTVDQVLVNMGAWVEQGQLLAVIDSTEVFQQAQQAAAGYYTAQADYQRNQQLYEQKLTSQQAFDNAEAQMKLARAGYELARVRLGYARVTAPFAGYVTRRFLDPGAQASAGATSLFTVMDLSRVKIAIDLLERDVPQVKAGMKAVIIADALPDKNFQGTVSRLSQAVDPATRTMRTEIIVPNPGGQLKPGMYATVGILLSEHANAVTVPSQAVLGDDQGSFVFVLADTVAKRVPVSPGRVQGARTEILSGLNGSEQVITTGQQYVKDGGAASLQRDGAPGAGKREKPSGKRK